MAGTSLPHSDEARAALHAIVTNPEYGEAALSSGPSTANLLKDLLPDAPKETAVLVAAAENGIATKLREFARQGMDTDTAVHLAASSMAESTAMLPEACEWAAAEMATALGLSQPASQPGAAGGSLSGPQPAVVAPPPPAGYQGAPSGYPGPQGPAPGHQSPPSGYQGPPSGYQGPPSGYQGPPSGYQGPPSGYQGAQQGPPAAYQGGGQSWPSAPNAPADPGQGWQQPGSPPAQVTQAWPAQGYPPQQAAGAPQAGAAFGGAAATTPQAWQAGQPGGPPPAKRKRSTLLLIVAAVVAVAVVIAVVAVLALNRKPSPSHHTATKPPVVSIATTAVAPNVNGNVIVYYLEGRYAHATVSANIGKAASGEVARLTAQPFPFSSAPVVINSTKLGSGAQHVSFRVTPTVATRYQIEVFASNTAANPLVRSATNTVYVGLVGHSKITSSSCPRPACDVTIRIRVHVPPAAINAEAGKHLYFYFGLHLGSSTSTTVPSTPTTLTLQTHVTANGFTIVSANEYQKILAFTFTVGTHAYRWIWNACTIETPSADGLGLPGSHLCGRTTIPASATFLG
jgi:hypothetical protein